MLTPLYLGAQLAGLAAVGCGVKGYLQTDDRILKHYMALAALANGISFALLGAWVGSGMSFLGSLRFWLASLQRAKPYAPYFFITQIIIFGLLYQNRTDIIPFAAAMLATFAVFYQRQKPMRFSLLAVTLMWLMHNLIHQAYPSAALEVFYLAANLRALTKRTQP